MKTAQTYCMYFAPARSPGHKLLLLSVEDNMGIFEEVGGPYPGRVKCPMTAAFVIPYHERSDASPVKTEEHAARVAAYVDLTAGAAP